MVDTKRSLHMATLLALSLVMLLITVGQQFPTGAGVEAAPLSEEKGSRPKVDQQLLAQAAAGKPLSYLIYFHDRADLSPAYQMEWEERGHYVVQTLQETAYRSQQEVRAFLTAQGIKHQPFWVDNVIAVQQSDGAALNGLFNFSEIASIEARRHVFLFEPVSITADSQIAQNPTPESNLVRVKAPEVWQMGIVGQGITVASIDTGVRYTHQALRRQYRGYLEEGSFNHSYNWWDPYNHVSSPVDTYDHGSHVTGTMVGDDGDDNQIGMAPGAKWIACMGFNPNATDAGLLECGQFLLAPWDINGQNPDPGLRPHVINNSWGSCGNPQPYDPWYQGVVDAWVAAGIYPVFANGNRRTPPFGDCPVVIGSVGNPARYGNVTGVGALGRHNGTLADYSLWGPSDAPDTINPRGYPYQKPQVSAPGTNRSALRANDAHYGDMSGTSMAAPHVAGLVALMWQAAPCLVGNYGATETIIEETAAPTQTPGYPGAPEDGPESVPNQATGWGEIDALAAVEAALASCGPSGALTGQVTDAASGQPLASVTIQAIKEAYPPRATVTDSAGSYTLTFMSEGVYTVTAQLFGYWPEVVSGVAVISDTTTVQNFALQPAPEYQISGVVQDSVTGWPLYARIDIAEYPLSPIWTNPVDGRYQVNLPAGMAYTFNVTAWVAGYEIATRTVGPVTGDRLEEFALVADPVSCNAPGYGFGSQSTAVAENDCAPAPGGLVVGNVYDENNSAPLVGAMVTTGAGQSAATMTTADPHVSDAFYTIFMPAGQGSLTATQVGGYAPVHHALNVVNGQTVGQDFSLPAGWLAYIPATIEAAATVDTRATAAFTMTNQGGLPLDYALSVLLLAEDFEGDFPPAGWTVVNNGGNCVWQRNDAWPNNNYAGGQGYAAAADSDACGLGTTMNTELRTPIFNLSGVDAATLEFMASYFHFIGSAFYVRASADAGQTWQTLLTWTSSQSPFGPGAPASLDLTPYAGSPEVMVSFHYAAPGWHWWVQVDQVRVRVENAGWISLAAHNGVLGSGDTAVVNVMLDGAAVPEPGVYQAMIEISDDTPYSVTPLPVTLTTAAWHRTYMPLMFSSPPGW